VENFLRTNFADRDVRFKLKGMMSLL